MSKLERQLDEIQGIKRVEIVWPITEEMYLQQLREQLRAEIDGHEFRVPLDLRGVRGTPQSLIELLFEMQEYAESQDKQLVISHAFGEMRTALDPRSQSRSSQADSQDASHTARDFLDGQLTSMQALHLQSVSQKGSVGRRQNSYSLRRHVLRWWHRQLKNRFVSMALWILIGTCLAVLIEWLVLFNLYDEIDPFRIDQPVSTDFEN